MSRAKRPLLGELLPDDVEFADTVLAVVKQPARAAAAKAAVATPTPAPAVKAKVSNKAVREWMKAEIDTLTELTVLPNGQTCGRFLFDEWKSRASKNKKQ